MVGAGIISAVGVVVDRALANIWQPCGNQVTTRWQTSGKQMVVATRWQPGGNQVTTRWQPSGNQVTNM